jgi:hypothetical protein
VEINDENKQNQNVLWKDARKGIIVFCFAHFFFEIILGNNKSALVPVLFNYWISSWYIKGQIEKGEKIKNLFLFGISVSGMVFLIRLVLGTIIFSFL